MLRAMNCILIILVLLLTALFGIIALLIIATEQPEGFFDNLYASSPKIARNETRMFAITKTSMFTTKMSPTTTISTTSMSTTKIPVSTTKQSTTLQSTTKQTTTFVPDDVVNSTTRYLQPFDLNLKLSNTEKVMSIGLADDERFYVAKANGELEFFNWTTLELLQTEHLDVQIHRLEFLSDGRIVVTEMQTKKLHLLDSDYKIVTQLKLGYQALDLKVFDDMIYVLSRLNGTIFVYDDKLVQKFKIEWAKENSCNFISPTGPSFVFVSCDNAVLKLSTDGKVVGRANVPGSLYSLAIYFDGNVLWAAEKGRKKIHVFGEDLQFKYELTTNSEENAIWSAIGSENGRVFALDYVSNEIQMFTIN